MVSARNPTSGRDPGGQTQSVGVLMRNTLCLCKRPGEGRSSSSASRLNPQFWTEPAKITSDRFSCKRGAISRTGSLDALVDDLKCIFRCALLSFVDAFEGHSVVGTSGTTLDCSVFSQRVIAADTMVMCWSQSLPHLNVTQKNTNTNTNIAMLQASYRPALASGKLFFWKVRRSSNMTCEKDKHFAQLCHDKWRVKNKLFLHFFQKFWSAPSWAMRNSTVPGLPDRSLPVTILCRPDHHID